MSGPRIMTSYLVAPNGQHGGDLIKLKIAILGDKQVGKSSLVSRYVKGTFSHVYLHTKGGDISEKFIHINGHSVHLTLIDSAGHKYVRSLIKSLYRNVHGILLVYDTTREKSFESLNEWIHQISLVNTGNPYIMMIGNKKDLMQHKAVPLERAALFAIQQGITYKEVSAKTGDNVAEAFSELIQGTYKNSLPADQVCESIKLTDADDDNDDDDDEKDGVCCS